MEYLAIEFDHGIQILNDSDELGGLIDNGIKHKVLGRVCDNRQYGDNCNTDCRHFCTGLCPATRVTDVFGDHWHVLIYK